jgi:hypothetical protein
MPGRTESLRSTTSAGDVDPSPSDRHVPVPGSEQVVVRNSSFTRPLLFDIAAAVLLFFSGWQ